MSHEKTEGLLLHAIPYLGRKQILKVFTPHQGLLTFATSLSPAPFCFAEWVYRHAEHLEIYSLLDFTLTDPLLALRSDYPTLTAAGQIARDLLHTQFPHKQAPELYALARLYLKKLSLAPDLLVASFRLKLLLHEGLLSPDPEPSFTPDEWAKVSQLAFLKQLSHLSTIQEAPLQKISHFFAERLQLSP
jgi:recombinational DNA repair protein (RecF pathway)